MDVSILALLKTNIYTNLLAYRVCCTLSMSRDMLGENASIDDADVLGTIDKQLRRDNTTQLLWCQGGSTNWVLKRLEGNLWI